MFILTAWVWIGIVMISMMISTSITSINGVVLMSIITSSELPLAHLHRHGVVLLLPIGWVAVRG